MTSVESGKLLRFALEFPLPEARVPKLTTFLVVAIVAVFTISAAADPGAYQALVPTIFVISAPPFAVRAPIAAIFSAVNPG